MNQIVTDEWIKVYGKNDELLVAGKVVCTKDSEGIDNDEENLIKFKGFSFENKFYFNEKSLNKTLFVKPNEEHLVKEFDSEHMPEYLSMILYRNCMDNPSNAEKDVYREFDIDELDEEVVRLVNALNQFDGFRTTGSCCGHNEFPLFVDIFISDLKPLGILLWVLNKPKYAKLLQITSCPDLKNNNIHSVMLRLRTTVIGEEAYKIADDFAKYLEVIGRN